MISISRARRVMRSRSGQGLVEFALMAPLLLLLIFGLIEFARAWNIRHVLTDAAREGTRVMAVLVNPPSDSAQKVITAAMATAGLAYANATVVYDTVLTPGSMPLPGGGQQTSSRVTITYPYRLGVVGVLLSWALPQRQLTIATSVTMRNE